MKRLLTCLLLSASFTAVHAEERSPVNLNQDQHGWVLEYMRHMLETIADMQGLVAAGKTSEVAARVQVLNEYAGATKPKGIGQQFPQGFRAMSQQMNRYWQQLETPSDDAAQVLQTSQQMLNTCNACHRVYYLTPPAE
ncbi:MAG: hypothetical protein KYX62_01570 [Pseudomonadota bacterium]|nr:hypothetical protein [Pseudomonadota bacterium]